VLILLTQDIDGNTGLCFIVEPESQTNAKEASTIDDCAAN